MVSFQVRRAKRGDLQKLPADSTDSLSACNHSAVILARHLPARNEWGEGELPASFAISSLNSMAMGSGRREFKLYRPSPQGLVIRKNSKSLVGSSRRKESELLICGMAGSVRH